MDPGEVLLAKLESKTGKTAKEFLAMAKDRGFDAPSTSWGTIMAWLKSDEIGLGHGYAMAVTHYIQTELGLKKT